ncbi:MAG: hypothetical protein ACXWC9_07070, partial [Pseudobdellovibrionaceae bacterium]
YLIATPLIRYVYAIFISKIDFSLLHSKIRKDLELEELKQYHFTLKQICEQLKHLLLGQQKLAESGKTILKEILTGRPIDRNHKHLLSYLNKITGPLDVLIPALEKFNAVEGSPTQLIENFTNRWQKTNELADGKVVKALESKKTDHPE